MNSIAILSLVGLALICLALIHETRLRRAAHNLVCRLIQSLGQEGKARDRARDEG